MRYMGIDYGTKRVGIALSDESGTMAFPEGVFVNDETLVPKLVSLINEKQVKKVVLGESRDFSGKENAIMNDVRELAGKLEKGGVEVFYEPEFLTSHQAAQIQGEHALSDASAAALILNSYLNREQ